MNKIKNYWQKCLLPSFSPLFESEEGLKRIALWPSVPDEGRHNSYADGVKGLGVSLLFGLCLCSCYADKGNYDYHKLDAVTISTEGTEIQDEYAIMRFDELELTPNVSFNGQQVTDAASAPLDYMWTFFSAASGAGSSNTIDTLGYDRHLKATIIRPSGNYFAQLTVTNRNDGISYFWRVPVAVSDAFDGGWMIFYECADHAGYSDLALVLNPWVKDNATFNRCYTDLYRLTNGNALPGHPIRCLDIAMTLSGHNVVGLCTDQTLVGVTDNAIELVMNFPHFFNEAPEVEKPLWYSHQGSGGVSGQSAEVLINDNKIYTNIYSLSPTGERESHFGIPMFNNDGGVLAAWNAELANPLQYNIVVYDQTYHRFLYAPYRSAQLEGFGAQDMSIAAFDVNATDMTFVMGDWGVGTSRVYAHDYMLMAKGSERYLAVANFSTSNPNNNAIGLGLYPLDVLCPDITSATTMSASNVGHFIYYGAGSHVYNLAYDSNQPADIAWTAPSPDEEVTCVRIMKYYHGSIYGAFGRVPQADNLVHIATWNPVTRQGHLYQYLINPASGILDETVSFDYPIPGRVKDMAWKFSMQ